MESSKGSPTKLIRDLSTQFSAILSPIDMHTLPMETQKIVLPIRQLIIDARLDVRDYELADTRNEQIRLGIEAKVRLESLQQRVLAASSHSIFGPADVAQISAHIQQIISLLT